MKTKLRFIPLTCAVILTSTGCAVQSPDLFPITLRCCTSAMDGFNASGRPYCCLAGFLGSLGDPVLVELITKALAANPDIETAAANLRAANASVTSANAALWPTASLGLNGSSIMPTVRGEIVFRQK